MQSRVGRHFHECRYIYSAFWISAVIFLLVCAGRGIWPLGGRSILKVDLFHQYAPYLEEFRSRVLSGKSLFYSWETGLGKDFLAQTAYYAASPLNLVVFLFPEKMISEMIALLILLKVSLCSASFTFYLREHYRRNDLSILVFGLLYGFCAFNTCYYWNVMWLDTVALFPLTALGCEKLILEKKITLYYWALTLTMIVNFYLAVLVCILITFYALVTALISHSCMEAAGRFILVSVLSALTAMVILAPVAAALTQTEVSRTSFPSFYIYPGVWQMVSAHFLGARDAVLARNEDMPNVYTGVLTLVLLPLYFSSRQVGRREKTLWSSLLLFMLLCSGCSTLDYMIHGFHFPANLPHRFTFVYSFILLRMAYRGGGEYLFPERKNRPPLLRTASPLPEKRPSNPEEGPSLAQKGSACLKKTETGENGQAGARGRGLRKRTRRSLQAVWGAAVLGAAAILLFEFAAAPRLIDIDHVLSGSDLVLNLILLGLYLSVVTTFLVLGDRRGKGWRKKTASRLVLPFLLVCVIGECSFSFYQNMHDTGDRADYIARMEDTAAAMARLEEAEKGDFFRTDFRRFVTINEGSLYHFNGFSHFSSLAPGGLCALMENLGAAAAGNSFRYYDNSPLLDALFRIRYCLNEDPEFPSADLAFKYRDAGREGGILIGRNDRALPLGFMVSEDILDWKPGDTQPFEAQNDFVRLAAQMKEDVFEILPPDLIQATNMEVYDVNEVGDVFSYTLADPYDLSLEPSVHAEFVSARDQYLCLYVDAANADRFLFETSDRAEDRELSAGRSTINVGYVSAGERIKIDFALTRRGEFDQSYPSGGLIRLFAAGWRDSVFQTAFDRLKREPLEIRTFTDTRIEGRVKASGDGILFTSIPYSAGWKVYVDGKPAEKAGLGEGGLIGIPVPKGNHEILLDYEPPFLMPALVCSFLGLLLFFFYRTRLTKAKRGESPDSGFGFALRGNEKAMRKQ